MAAGAVRSCFTYAKLAFEQLPFHFCFGLLNSATRRLYDSTLGSVRKTRVFLMRGRLKNSDCPLTAVLVGSEESANQFARVAYSSVEFVRSVGEMLCRHVEPAYLPKADITVERSVGFSNSGARRRAEEQSCFVLPTVDFSLDLNQSLVSIEGKASRRRRRDLRKVKDLGYAYTVCRGCYDDFEFFFRTMYFPFVEKRYNKAALFRSYVESKARYRRNGGILFVEEDGERIAGILFQKQGKTVYALSLGLRNGDNGFQKSLAGTAALFQLISWAKENGLATLNYGATVPFFNDGLFVYKKEWGMSISTRASYGFWTLKINTLSRGAILFLKENPFIASEKGKMRAVVLLDDEDTEIDSGHLASEFMLPNLDSPVILAYRSGSISVEGFEEFQGLSCDFAENLTKSLSGFRRLMVNRART